jgi:hypothetical protein
MQELCYVDTAAEKLIETVSWQKFTVSETTHDNEYRKHAVTSEKMSKGASQQETWRSRRTVCLFFCDLGAACTA